MKKRVLRSMTTGVLFLILLLQGCNGLQSSATPTPIIYLTETPLPTPIPTGTVTPVPDAIVNFALVQVLDGPAWHFAFVTNLRIGEPVTITGKDAGCHWLQVTTSSGQTGWVNAEGGRIYLHIPCEEVAFGTTRPENGFVFLDMRTKEAPPELRLNVFNKSPSFDGVILLTDENDKPYLGLYIQAQSTVSVQGIPEGKYNLYFTTGDGWDMSNHRFVEDAFYGKLAKPITFRVIYIFNSNTTKYEYWDIPLQELVAGTYNSGQVQVVVLSPEEFPVFEWTP